VNDAIRSTSGKAADQVRTRHQSQNRKGDGLTIPEAFLARADEVIE
jgi:hypothetical protein